MINHKRIDEAKRDEKSMDKRGTKENSGIYYCDT